MTPHDIDLVRRDIDAIDADELAIDFYATLFDLAPEARTMFPDDMTQQRRKLMTELSALIELGTAAESGRIGDFVDRAQRLGRRHVRYATEGSHYAVVGSALLTALRHAVAGWDDDHERAWTVLYTTVAEVMREGAAQGAMAAPVQS